ncbi:hypothetical protein CY34DRAFT_363199 [Suillus luteus UH-Slu-Lm8-n1]|uniref:DUF6533 domain-containing protein n=1 Tax=Suillus luteus UH-Slu-Lm8-n1 TaxID=930992 RepID=A0A0C9ZMX9_9AGAM|nr:hypothetical protein CY34DRAFT_363199 [Suillus luteus UH-Slu-Lm8-n1]
MRSLYVHQVPGSPERSLPSSNSMTLISNDPSWWPILNANLISSYFIVAASVALMYDWALTFGQEIELIWRQRWSLMTFLYLSVRYVGIVYAVVNILVNVTVPTFLTTDAVSLIIAYANNWASDIVNVILGVIMIVRLHAMYQRSRKVLTFLVVIFVAIRIVNAVMAGLKMMQIYAEEFVLSGTYYMCMIGYHDVGEFLSLNSVPWMLDTVWEALALCLAVWVAAKHLRELRQHSTSSVTGDCFTALMKTHVCYFVSFVAVSCFELSFLSPTLSANFYLPESQVYAGFIQIFTLAQMFVLGPRLILGVREYHAKLVADSDAATAMTSIAFQERVHVAISSSV